MRNDTSDWRYDADDRVVNVYRDAFGMPRLEQPRERPIGYLAVMCCVGVVLGAWLLAWVVTR
jgi:hypothetical protein